MGVFVSTRRWTVSRTCCPQQGQTMDSQNCPTYRCVFVCVLCLSTCVSQPLCRPPAASSHDGLADGTTSQVRVSLHAAILSCLPLSYPAQGHFKLVNHQLQRIRSAFALGTVLGRAVVMPELWCGQDRWWAPHSGNAHTHTHTHTHTRKLVHTDARQPM